MKKKIQDLIALYGKLAFIIYLSIFFLVFVTFYLMLQAGVDLESLSWFQGRLGQAGTVVIAWVATKLTQPIRIAVTVAITPIVAHWFGKKERKDEKKISN